MSRDIVKLNQVNASSNLALFLYAIHDIDAHRKDL